jgi:hypothetical protein
MVSIDDHWLNDNELASIGSRNPSTAWGVELMREAWPKRYTQPLMSSDTYRGVVMGLATICSSMHHGISVGEIRRIVEEADQSLKTSAICRPQSDLYGGASLAIVNAWTTAAGLGFTAEQIAVAYDSELIYAARTFVRAHQLGL